MKGVINPILIFSVNGRVWNKTLICLILKPQRKKIIYFWKHLKLRKRSLYFYYTQKNSFRLSYYLINTKRVIIVPCEVIYFLFNQDNIRLRSSPSFSSLHYQDAGNYVCETALQEVEGLKKSESLTLIVEGNWMFGHQKLFVENLIPGFFYDLSSTSYLNCNDILGKPQIKMTKKTDPSGLSKTIICHVEGFPKPAIQWTITGSGSVINQASICLLITFCPWSNIGFYWGT